MSDSLGDRMKSYEMETAGRKLLPLIPVMARIDGRSFSKFTKGLKRPFDSRFSDLMIETTAYLVGETNANCGYTQSDEITLTWYTSGPNSEMLFSGRIQKLESVLAGMASGYFQYQLPSFLSDDYAAKLPHFDCRVWNVPTLEEGANCFLWREWDATKNSISMAAHHYFSHASLQGRHGDEMKEMLFKAGINWNEYPVFFKRGTYVQRSKVLRKFTTTELSSLPAKHEARLNPDLMVERTEFSVVAMPVLSTVVNRVGAIYFGETPIVNQGA